MNYPQIAGHIFNTPLMVHPGKAAAMMAGFGGRLVGTAIDVVGPPPIGHVAFSNGRPSMGVVGDRLGRVFDRKNLKPYDMVGNVAVIPVEGTLVHKGSFVESSSGETSYEGLQTQVRRAAADASVKGVVFEIDSYGGQVAGAFETADMIHALSGAKPTLAILTDHAYSAGYLMASAARQIILPETGGAGSIGVITMHVDYSAMLEKAGQKVTVLSAGAHKADGNPYEPLPEDVAQRVLARLEASRQIFAGKVSQYRGKRLSFEGAMATEALDYPGAEAVRAGLADATGSPQDAFEAFISQLNRA